jgi:hypothetical protein
LPTANSIYPPLADSNGNSGIHAAGNKTRQVPGTVFLDKKISINLVPGTGELPLRKFAYPRRRVFQAAQALPEFLN